MKLLLLRGSGLLKIKPELPKSTRGIIYDTNSNRLLDRGFQTETECSMYSGMKYSTFSLNISFSVSYTFTIYYSFMASLGMPNTQQLTYLHNTLNSSGTWISYMRSHAHLSKTGSPATEHAHPHVNMFGLK